VIAHFQKNPSDVNPLLHHELAQTHQSPSHLFFYCERELLPMQFSFAIKEQALTDGETPILASDTLHDKVKKASYSFICWKNRRFRLKYGYILSELIIPHQ